MSLVRAQGVLKGAPRFAERACRGCRLAPCTDVLWPCLPSWIRKNKKGGVCGGLSSAYCLFCCRPSCAAVPPISLLLLPAADRWVWAAVAVLAVGAAGLASLVAARGWQA